MVFYRVTTKFCTKRRIYVNQSPNQILHIAFKSIEFEGKIFKNRIGIASGKFVVPDDMDSNDNDIRQLMSALPEYGNPEIDERTKEHGGKFGFSQVKKAAE